MTKQQADKWIRFLRSYGPGPRNGNMYAEEIAGLSRQYGIGELRFEHPMERTLFGVIDPSQGRLTNVVLTGTAGDGKTWLCYRLWEHLGGQPGELEDLPPYKSLNIPGTDGPKTVHFIFDLSGWAPEKGQDRPVSNIDLLNRFATSVAEGGDEFFVLACNDGKLVQVWQELQQKGPRVNGYANEGRPGRASGYEQTRVAGQAIVVPESEPYQVSCIAPLGFGRSDG